jgi:hypothetical protein
MSTEAIVTSDEGRKLEACNLHLFQHAREHTCEACGWPAYEHRNNPHYNKLAHREEYVSDVQLRSAFAWLVASTQAIRERYGLPPIALRIPRGEADGLNGTLEMVVRDSEYLLRYVPRATVAETPAEASKPAAELPAGSVPDLDYDGA